MQSEHFIYDGIKSQDMGIYIIQTYSGFIRSPFFGGQDVKVEINKNRLNSYFYGVTKRPIEFTVELSPLDEEWTPQFRKKIGEWLFQDTYKPFQTCDDLGKIYYALCTDAVDVNLYRGNKGYIEVTFKTNSPYAWSPVYVDEFNLSDNNTTKIIEMENISNVVKTYSPKVEIQLLDGATGVTLRNLSNDGKEFKFEGLHPNERVSIDNENQFIMSDNPLSNPFAKFNRGWLELVYGVNRIEVTGKCKIWTKMQFPILQ